MTKRRLLLSLILAIVGIVMTIVSASVYVVLTDKSHTSNDESKSAEIAKKQEIGTVTGIAVDGISFAVIDGLILREGQSICQVKVVKINSDSVEFEYKGTRWSKKVVKTSSTPHTGTIDKQLLNKYPSMESIVKNVSPAVVTILNYDDSGEEYALGSGLFIGDGKILTNAHVIENAYSVKVCSLQKTYKNVTIDKRDDKMDLAVLSVQSAGEPTILLTDDNDFPLGQQVYAIGNPYGRERTLSYGHIISIDDSCDIQEIQITAPTYPGNSGGPLLNMQGSVIGIVCAYKARDYDDEPIRSLAIGIKSVEQFLQTPDKPVQLKKAGSFILWKVILRWVKKPVTPIIVLIVATFVLYRKKRFYLFTVIPFLNKKMPVAVEPAVEPYQPVVLSSNKLERHWRSR
jgi:S1-C subfamily serine protease